MRRRACQDDTLSQQESSSNISTSIYREAHIHDEIAVFLPAPGGASIAIFVERSADDFDGCRHRTHQARLSHGRGLHKTHLDWLFINSNHDIAGTLSQEIPRAVMILDRDGRRVFASREWRDTERRNPTTGSRHESAKGRAAGLIEFADNMVVHAEKLLGDFPYCPQRNNLRD